MADPLSVSASVVGILVAAQKISSYIGVIVSKSKRAPEELLDLKSTIDTTHAILSRLQTMLLGQGMINPQRTSLVLVDQVVIILTTCVKIFSGLDILVGTLQSGVKIALLDKIRWATKSDEVKEYLQKLELQKNSLSLILTILTCESTLEANNAVERLEALVIRIFESDEPLAERMSTLKHAVNSGGSATVDSLPTILDDSSTANTSTYDFQKELESSRAYSRVGRWLQNDTFSIGSTSNGSTRWSIMSGLSLSGISSIGVVNLPITTAELSNGQLYVSKEIPGATTESETWRARSRNSQLKKERRTTFIASTEYVINDLNIKNKNLGQGVLSELLSKCLARDTIIWVVPSYTEKEYPISRFMEPLSIPFQGNLIKVLVKCHTLKNITYVLLDCDDFRAPAFARGSDTGKSSKRCCSIWNQAIAKIMQRFTFDIYLVFELHCTLSLLYLLPATAPCCYLHFETANRQDFSVTDFSDSLGEGFQVDEHELFRYFGREPATDFLFMIASYFKVHQMGHGFVNIGDKSTYNKHSLTHKTIAKAGLKTIAHITFPDPSDDGPWDAKEYEEYLQQVPLGMTTDQNQQDERARDRLALQNWAGLELKARAETIVFVGQWYFDKGIDLIAGVMRTILEQNHEVQFVCIGPQIDQYGIDAARVLEPWVKEFPGRVSISATWTACPPCVFSGAEFALVPFRYDPIGIASLEFGRKGAISIGAVVGGQGRLPGFWYTCGDTMDPEILKSRFKWAIENALRSTEEKRVEMRRLYAITRSPIVLWTNTLHKLQDDAIQHYKERQRNDAR